MSLKRKEKKVYFVCIVKRTQREREREDLLEMECLCSTIVNRPGEYILVLC